MTAVAMTFSGQVPFDDPTVPAGGCELGMGRCMQSAEIEVRLPATNDVRRLCREHVGWYMLGATAEHRLSRVLVRSITPGLDFGQIGTHASP